MKVDWDLFKTFVDTKEITVQFLETPSKYMLWAYDGPFHLSCELSRNPSDSTELDDFELAYKPAGNKPVVSKMAQVFAKDNTNLSPRSCLFTAAANSITSEYKLIDTALCFRGGLLFASGSTIGDSIQVKIVDVDNILGYGAGTILATYLKEWLIFPNVVNELVDISISSSIMQGLYFKFEYTNTHATNNIQVIINLLSYEQI